MKILVTGACGFVGSALCRYFRKHRPGWELFGADNLSRQGSEKNVEPLRNMGVAISIHDLKERNTRIKIDWIIHCAANPSVMAGFHSDPIRTVDDNFTSTKNLLELCKDGIGFIYISTSRVYSISVLRSGMFSMADGIFENDSTNPPLSLYGTTKRMSEMLALEMAGMFNFPCYINRCGLMAGAGQFGNQNQGIVSYWINSWKQQKQLQYIGHNGEVTRDLLHPDDLAALLVKQIERKYESPIIANVSGGIESQWTMTELSEWCAERFGAATVLSTPEKRPFDVPWLVLDNSKAKEVYDWSPTITKHQIWEEIANS